MHPFRRKLATSFGILEVWSFHNALYYIDLSRVLLGLCITSAVISLAYLAKGRLPKGSRL